MSQGVGWPQTEMYLRQCLSVCVQWCTQRGRCRVQWLRGIGRTAVQTVVVCNAMLPACVQYCWRCLCTACMQCFRSVCTQYVHRNCAQWWRTVPCTVVFIYSNTRSLCVAYLAPVTVRSRCTQTAYTLNVQCPCTTFVDVSAYSAAGSSL